MLNSLMFISYLKHSLKYNYVTHFCMNYSLRNLITHYSKW